MKKLLLLAVCLCSISALGQIPDCSFGICAGVGVPTLKCRAGQKYTQADAPGNNYTCSGIPPHWVADPGGSTMLSNPYITGTTYFFGDSTNTIGNSHASVPQNSGVALLWKDLNGTDKRPYSVSGTLASQIAASELTYFVPPAANISYALPKVFANGGINDANTCSTANCVANYAAQQQAGLAWMLSPNKLMASTATITGFSSSATVPLNAAITGTAEKSTTNGNTLSFSGTATGTKVGITYIATAASGGTFTVAVNGSNVNGCSGTTTWASNGCGTAVGFNTPMRQEFTVTPGAYTVLITVTSSTNAANPVEILDVDSSPTSTANQPVVFQYGVIYQNADANSAATAAYNASVQSTVAALASENLNVNFIDLRAGNPGVNSTTDMAASSTACPANANTALHPNDCGYANEVKTIENAVAAAGYPIFFPNTGAPVGPITTPYGYQSVAPTTPTTWADSWNTNGSLGNGLGGGAPSATSITPIMCYFPLPGVSPGATHIACTGLLFDVATSAFATGIVSDFDFEYLSCPSSNLNYTGCTALLNINKTTGAAKFSASLPRILYSAAGTALPSCVVGIQGEQATVSDATAPTYMGAYASGGAITAAVVCSFNGTTFAWLTH